MSLTLALVLAMTLSPPVRAGQKVFEPLRSYLIKQGFSPQRVDRLLANPRLKFEAKTLARMLSVSESSLNYGQFLSKSTIAHARQFGREHKSALDDAAKVTGVEPRVVLAILSVETRLGDYTGESSAFNMLASQAVLDTTEAKAQLAKYWPKNSKRKLDSGKEKRRFKRKAAWAKEELGALMRMAKNDNRSPFSYQGSPAGAMGIPQFMPTSLHRWGLDGDMDGRVDLHQPVDAIFSTANYLKEHGWRNNLSYKQKIKVVLTYNNSQPYARTVLKLAEALK